jgi:hypothetical protein
MDSPRKETVQLCTRSNIGPVDTCWGRDRSRSTLRGTRGCRISVGGGRGHCILTGGDRSRICIPPRRHRARPVWVATHAIGRVGSSRLKQHSSSPGSWLPSEWGRDRIWRPLGRAALVLFHSWRLSSRATAPLLGFHYHCLGVWVSGQQKDEEKPA